MMQVCFKKSNDFQLSLKVNNGKRMRKILCLMRDLRKVSLNSISGNSCITLPFFMYFANDLLMGIFPFAMNYGYLHNL